MILIVYASAGQGHRMAALALEEELDWRGALNDTEVIDSLSILPPSFSKFYAGSYWYLVHFWPWMWLFFFWLFNLKIIHRLDHFLKKNFPSGVLARLENYLKVKNPRSLVFTHFLGIHNAIQLRKKGLISSHIRAVVTDFYAHALWIHDEIDEYCVMSEETRRDMIGKWGIREEKIRVTGIPVSRKFTDPARKKDRSFRRTLGLEENRLTLLFTSGSFGFGPTEEYLRSLFPLSEKIQAIVVCGNNAKMKEELTRKSFPFPVAILGFVTNMHELMDISDLVVAKPGGITTCESLIKSVPMIVFSVIPGQEQGNLKILELHKASWRLHSGKELYEMVKNILENPRILEEMKKNLATLAKPNATRDIVDLILAT